MKLITKYIRKRHPTGAVIIRCTAAHPEKKSDSEKENKQAFKQQKY